MITVSTVRCGGQTCEGQQAFPWQGTLQTHTAAMGLNMIIIMVTVYNHGIKIGFTLFLSATILWKERGDGRSPLVSTAVHVLECPYQWTRMLVTKIMIIMILVHLFTLWCTWWKLALFWCRTCGDRSSEARQSGKKSHVIDGCSTVVP